MNTAGKKLGTIANFFPDGVAYTVPSAGTAGRSSKPGELDTGWVSLGIIEEAKDKAIESEKTEIFAPSPGQQRLYDIIENKIKQSGSFLSKELSPLAIQALYRTAALTSASTQFNRFAGVLLKGWLKIQRYDQTNTLTITEDLFVVLEVDGEIDLGGGLAEVPWMYTVLQSTLNTSTL